MQRKIIILATLVCLTTLMAYAWTVSKLQSEVEVQIDDSLSSILKATKNSLKIWSINQVEEIEVFVSNVKDVSNYTQQLMQLPNSKDKLIKSTALHKIRAVLRPLIEAENYQGFFIIGPNNVNLASMRDSNIGQRNLLVEQPGILQSMWSGSGAMSLPQMSDVPLKARNEDGKIIMIDNAPTMFIGAPIKDSTGKVIALLTFRVNPWEDFAAILSQGRMGRTGETYAFDRFGRMLSDSRFHKQLNQVGAFHGTRNIDLRDPGRNILDAAVNYGSSSTWPHTFMISKAIKKMDGIDTKGHRNYIGVPVVSAWSWDEHLGFGVATEIAVSEAYYIAYSYRNLLAIYAVFCIALIIGIAVVVLLSRKKFIQSELKLRKIIDLLPNMIYAKDRDGNFIMANQATANVFGTTVDKMLGKQELDYNKYYESDDSPAVIDSQKVKFIAEEPRTSHKGEMHIFQTVKIPYAPSGDKATAMLAVATDITDRKESEEAVFKAEEQLRLLLNSAGLGIYGLDIEGALTFVNPAAANMLGYAANELIGRTPHKILHHSYPNASPYPLQNCPLCVGFKDGKTIVRNNEVFWRSDGSALAVEYRSQPVMKDKEIIGAVVTFFDITERKLSEDALRSSEIKYQGLFDSAPIPYFSVNNYGMITFANNAAIQFTGYSLQELKRVPLVNLCSSHQSESLSYIVSQNQLESIHNAEMEFVRKDGEKVHGLLSVNLVRGKSMNIEERRIVVVDISERKIAESALKNSEERFNLAMLGANDGLWDWDLSNDKIYFSPRWKEMLGHTDNELKNNLQVWKELLHEGDSKRVLDVVDQYLAKEIREFHVEYRMRHKDGSYVDILSRGTAIWNDKDIPIRLIGTHVDISERKRIDNELQEQRTLFEAVFRDIPDAMLITNINREMLMCNPGFSKSFGYIEADVIGKTTQMLYADQAEYKEHGKTRFNLTAKQQAEPYVVTYMRINGEVFLGETVGTAISDPNGEVLGYLGVIRDISARVKTEEQKINLQQQLQQAQKMESIGQLTGGIAHDFNNILASIMGYTELVLELYVDESDVKMGEYLNQVKIASARARNLVKQMLTFSRTSGGDHLPTMLSSVVEESINMIRPMLPSSIEVITQQKEDIVPILGDSGQLNQVLMNLCINARDAMNGQGNIIVKLEQKDDIDVACSSCHTQAKGTYVVIEINDNGEGISKEFMSRMFEPFASTKKEGKGTGMGLAMVHGIVHSHKGHIVVNSEPGEGTSFKLLFPLSEHQYEEDEEEQDIPLTSEISGKKGYHVMVVDDEESVAHLLKAIFLSRGYAVKDFTNSQEAMDYFETHTDEFDLIVTDQTMPHLTGAEMSTKMLHIRPEIPIILCTGYSEYIDEEKALAIGIKGYVDKPINTRQILSLAYKYVGEMIENRKAS